jgi:hypothetical protein
MAIWLVVAQSYAATEPVLPDPGRPSMSREQQVQLGREVAAQVYQQMPVLPDSSPETQYIQALGKRQTDTIPKETSWPFEFHVIPQKEINAFAIPGGAMFVNVGTITAAKTEAELAGVMAHEIAHVYMQHSAKQQDKGSLLGGLAGLAGALAGAIGGVGGALAQLGIQFGAGTLMLKYSRGDETQADAVGAVILWKVGINPVALADFFQTMEGEGGSSGPQFLSSHPNPGNRRTAIQKQISDWPAKQYSGNTAQFTSARQHATGVQVYTAQEIEAGAKSGRWEAENRKNGAVLPGASGGASNTSGSASAPAASASMPAVPLSEVRPSRTFRTADLGGLRISRPENWEVLQNEEAAALIAPRAGVSNAGIAYGVVIGVERASANMNLNQLTTAVLQSLQRGDPNMKQVGRIQRVTVNGIASGSVLLETISPMVSTNGKQQPEQDWLVVVPRGGGNAIYFVFVSPRANYYQLRPSFQTMLNSVQFQ